MSSTIPSHIGSKLGQSPSTSEETAINVETNQGDGVDQIATKQFPVMESISKEPQSRELPIKKRKARNIRRSKVTVSLKKNAIDESSEENQSEAVVEKTESVKIADNQINSIAKEETMPAKNTKTKPALKKSSKANIDLRVDKEQGNENSNLYNKSEAKKFVKKLSSDTQSFLEKLRKERLQRSKEVAEMKKKINSELKQNHTDRISQQKELSNQLDDSRQERLSNIDTIKKEVKEILKK